MVLIGVDNPVPSPNTAPSWTSDPTPSGTVGTSKNYDLNQHVFDIDGDTIAYTTSSASVAFPAGWTISGTDLAYDGAGSASATANIVLDADDGVNTPVASNAFTITINAALSEFPLYDLYSALVTARGGVPIAENTAYYWDKPTFPTSAGSTVSTISALTSAIALASAGDVIFLQDGVYTDNATVTCGISGAAASRITIAPETLGGAEFTGDLKFLVTGSYLDLMGFKFSGDNDEVELFDIESTATKNLFAYNEFSSVNCTNANNNQFNFFNAGEANRCCYNTITNKDSNRQVFRSSGTASYERYDHNACISVLGGAGAGDDECIQFDQAGAARNHFGLADNNYIYRWNNDGTGSRTSSSENECTTNKSSGNMFIRNYFLECLGNLNDRESHRSTYYANIIDGGEGNQSSGIGLGGSDSYAFCNYIIDVNNDGSSGQRGIAMRDGGDGTYEPSLNNEMAFNVIIGSGRSMAVGEGGNGSTKPTDCTFYNNAIGTPIGISVNSYKGTGHVWDGNVISSALGIASAPAGILVESPELTVVSASSGVFYVPTSAGNCDGSSKSGFNSLCTVDLFGTPIPASAGNSSCFQDGWDFSTDPAQSIIDNAGVSA